MIRVIGAGPGDIKYLTVEAYEIIKSSDCIAAFGRISKIAEKMGVSAIKVKNVEDILKIARRMKNLDILASGDPCFFGIAKYLRENGVKVDQVIPGLSSFQYMMAKLDKSWEKACFISFHGREDDTFKKDSDGTFVILTDRRHTPGQISKMVYDMGISGRIYAGFNLSYADEKIVVKNIGEDIENYSDLSVVVVESEMDKG
ncbi:MAG: precorrin-6y C5,15-methyltransferase (decarboxylating) subunit CbiE [Clostridiales bacterium]|nr:precorrin-6y C5,15-methyltransferase (decarboxylating) subunit CbiE [Clostridiales bacterium]